MTYLLIGSVWKLEQSNELKPRDCLPSKGLDNVYVIKKDPSLHNPSFGTHLFAYHLVLEHTHTNMILSSFCFPKVVKRMSQKFWKSVHK